MEQSFFKTIFLIKTDFIRILTLHSAPIAEKFIDCFWEFLSSHQTNLSTNKSGSLSENASNELD